MRKGKTTYTIRIAALVLALCMLLCGLPYSVQETEAEIGNPYDLSPPLHGKWVEDNGDGTYDLNISIAGDRRYDANIVLVVDVSSSMVNNKMTDLTGDPNASAMTTLREVAKNFVNTLFSDAIALARTGSQLNMAIVWYAGNAEILNMWTDDRETLLASCDKFDEKKATGLGANTNCQAGYFLANELYEKNTIAGQDTNRPTNLDTASNIIVFMTDGAPNRAYVQSGTISYTKLNDNYGVGSSGSINVDQLDYTPARPSTTYNSSRKRVTTDAPSGTILSREIKGTDYRRFAAEALLVEAERASENPCGIRTVSVGLGVWFEENDEDSEFPTAVNLTRLVTLVGNNTITLDEACSYLGPDVGSGAMPGSNPPYPIIDTVDGVYKGNAYYDRFKSGTKYALDVNLTNLTLTQLKEWITLYYGTPEEQMLDGIYRLPPLERGDTTIDLVAESERYTFFGSTAQIFENAFEDISRDLIITGYSMVRISDMLSRNIQFAEEIPQSDLDKAIIDPVSNSMIIENPSFISVRFYVHSHLNQQGDWHDEFSTFEEHVTEYVYDPNPPDASMYTTRYIRTNDAIAQEYLELEFDERHLLGHEQAAIMTIRVKPTQYCIDTLYYNTNNPSFQAQSYAMSEMETKTDGIDPAAFVDGVAPDTNSYPDEAFVMGYIFDEDDRCVYDETNTVALDFRSYDANNDGQVQYGFFTNVHTESEIDYQITNLNTGNSDLVHVPMMMPVFKPELTDVEISKIWHEDSVVPHEPAYATVMWDQNIYDFTVKNGIKTEVITGTQTLRKTVELSEENNWHNTFVGLPQGHTFTLIESDAEGTPIMPVYVDADTDMLRTYIPEWELCDDVVSEAATLSGTTFTIDNPATSMDLLSGLELYNQQAVDKTVTKVWNDNGNSLNRPDSVTVMLFRDGEPYREAVMPNPLTGANTWTYTFESLPAYNTKGELSVYTVTETSDLNTKLDDNGNHVTDYSSTTDQSTLTITNTDPGILTDITASKVWDDNNNRDGIRPSSVVLNLFSNGTQIGSETVSAATNWTCQWHNLPVYANNNRVEYTVTEDLVEGYTQTITKNGSYYTVTNTHVPETLTIPITKAWDDMNNQDGIRPDDVEVQLVANGVPINGQKLKLTKTDNWTGAFTGIPKYSDGGTLIEYSVQENSVIVGYTSAVTGDTVNGFTITNTHVPALRDVTVNKVWNDGDSASRPASVAVQLYSNGTAYGSAVTLNTANNWQYTFTELPVRANGKDIAYTVREPDIPNGYTASYLIDGLNLTVVNSENVTRTIKKVWNDNNNAEGNRPEHIWVQLLRNGVNYSSPSLLSAESSWQFVWTNLPMYDTEGVAYTYTIQEVMYPELDTYYEPTYSSSGNTLTVTNTQDFADSKIVINKTWGNAEGEHAFLDAQFDLYRTTTQTVGGVTTTVEDHVFLESEVLSWADSWSRTVTLPRWRIVDGVRYDYTYDVVENCVRMRNNSLIFSSFTDGMTTNEQYYSVGTRNGDVWDYVNYRPLATVGAQAHIIHETSALDTAPVYTDGIRFAYDISVPALDALLDTGDLFTFGFLLYPKHLLDSKLPTDAPTVSTAQNYLMHLNITTDHVWSSAFGEAVIYCARAKDKSSTISAASTVTWTAQMEAAANRGDVDGLISLLQAEDCVIFERIGTNSLRIVAHMMFSSTDPELRQRQADTILTYRGFMLMQRDGVDSVVYTMQRQNSATRVFNSYLYEKFMPDYDVSADPDGYVGLGISDYFPAIDIQTMP